MKRFAIYKRVSTDEQGRSGLGLAAQDRDIRLFLESFAEEPHEVMAEFTEIQTGRADDRPQLALALDLARKAGADLLVSKLDRLSRRVSFIAALMEDPRLKLRVASMPNADNFQLHVYAALAEQERKFIAARTKAALAEAKARGRKLGGLRDQTGRRNEAVKANALERAGRVRSIVMPLREQGATLQAIADALNAAGVGTARGKQWHASQVQRTLSRLG